VSKKKCVNILITSAGGLTGTFLLKHLSTITFSNNYKYKLVAVDINNQIPAINKSAAFYVVPSVTDSEAYISEISKIIKKEKIDLVLPVLSKEVDLFCDKNFVDERKVLLCDSELNKKLSNKILCNELLRSLGLLVPEIATSFSGEPLVFKPCDSSGSKGVVIIKTKDDFEYYSKKNESSFFTQYIEGEEYTVDCLFDKASKCIGYNSRVRIKTVGGGATVSTNKFDPEIEETIRILEANLKLRGALNFQYIKKDGKNYLIDFNTRFASGGLPLTVKSGFDVPNELIRLIILGEATPWKAPHSADGLTMVKYYNEVYFK
jgi:carbamoyl-phosphate synthase large subunit